MPESTATADVTAEDQSNRQTPRRSRGRPRGGFLPQHEVDWRAIEKAYIYGDVLDETGDPLHPDARHYPSMRELSERFGLHGSAIGTHSKRFGWVKRRKAFMISLQEETDRAVAKAAALSTADAVGIIDVWVGRFETALQANQVRADNVSDLNCIMRLREFLLGNADSRAETTHTLTLDAMQKRFADNITTRRKAGELKASDALAGVLNEQAPGHVLDTVEHPAIEAEAVEADALDAAREVVEGAGDIAGNTENTQSTETESSDSDELAYAAPRVL